MRRLLPLLLVSTSLVAQDWRYERLTPAGESPSARLDGTIAYDANSAGLFLFGGQSATTLNDLWAYSLPTNQWQLLEPDGAIPPARLGHTLLTDQKRNRLILFGGQARGFFSDVWAYDIGTNRWALLAADNAGPSLRYGHSAVIDASTDRMIISHGFTNSGRFDDTWAFDLTTNQWNNLTPAGTKPLRRCLHHAVLDTAGRQMFLYGGCASGFGPCPLGDLWSFNLQTNTWTEVSPSIKPPARQHYGFSFDSRRNRIVLFGGSGAGLLGDTWFFDPASRTWNQLPTSSPAPTPRLRHQGAYAAERGATYFFGGSLISGSSSELWVLMSGLLPQPRLIEGGAVNAFSGIGGAVAPGEYISMFGDSIGPDPVPEITINGSQAPHLFANNSQVNLRVPETLAPGQAIFRVTRNGEISNELTLPVVDAHPGLFPTAVNEDGSLNSSANPAAPGSIVVFYATGQGLLDGSIIRLDLAGSPAQILYAGASPGAIGLLQVNARVPSPTATGAASVKLYVKGFESQAGVELHVRN